MKRENFNLPMFRVEGYYADYGEPEIYFDEFCSAANAQAAADRVREWHSDKSECQILEIAKVMKGWK